MIGKKGKLDYVDGYVLVAALILSAIGILMVFSITGVSMFNNPGGDAMSFVIRSVAGTLAGLFMMVVMTLLPNAMFRRKMGFPILFLTVAFFVLTPILGEGTDNSPHAYRWLVIGGVRFQAVEVSRIGFVLSMAWITQLLVNKHLYYTNKIWSHHLIPLVYTFFCTLTVLLQPDLGSGAVILGMGTIMFLSSGISKKQIIPLVLVALGSMVVIGIFGVYVLNLEVYQLDRIHVWLDPFTHEDGLQSRMGFIAIALGGLFGVGLGASTQALGFSIEPHTDLIITILAEELGLIAVIGVMVLYFLIAVRCFLTAFKAREVFSALVCIGCGAFFLIQPLINLGGSSGMIPLSGVTLPLISYGMTSQISIFIMLGIYFNMRRYILVSEARYQKMKEAEETAVESDDSKILHFPQGTR